MDFTTTADARPRGGLSIRLPVEPSMEWGDRERYDVSGTVNGCKVRGKLISRDGGHYLELGPAWCRDNTVSPGVQVAVRLEAEGPQVASMSPDLAAALDAAPDARRFFESLPTFYRKNFMRWIDAAKRPETRAKRIAEMVETLKAGKRER
ncbi:MAG TPA: YdeI/OmpD-associated family protein [Chloroflexota bacterium]